MKRTLLILALLILPVIAFGQSGTTAVTAVVRDANGTLFVNCQWSVVFVGQNTTPGAGPYAPASLLNGQQGNCDSFAALNVNLADNINTVTPTPSQWAFSICSAPGYVPGGTYCKANILITITGATQDITAQLSLQLPLLPIPGGGGCVGCSNGVIPQFNGFNLVNSLPQIDNNLTNSQALTIADPNGLVLPGDGTHAGSIQLNGNTANPALASNTVGFIGPSIASFTKYACQIPSSAPSGGQVLQCSTPDGNGVSVGTWVSAGGGGTGNVSTTPAGSQDIVQPAGTEFSANNLAGIRYVSISPSTYNWSVTQAGTVTGSTTVTFATCPLGVRGSDTNLYVTINAGTESDVSTGAGTCVPGSAGTLIFNVTGSYSSPTISSASSGIYEGIIDAESSGTGTAHANFRVIVTPTNPPASTFYAVYAPVIIANGLADIDGSGASIDCESLDQCFWIKTTGELTFHGFRFGTKTAAPSAAISNTACASNVSTITTTLNPPVGSWVDIQNTDNPHYWSLHQVATTAGSNWTYTDTNCGGLTTIASAATPGGNAREHSAIHDSGQELTIRDIYFDTPGWGTSHTFGSWVVVDLDQGFQLDHVTGGGGTVANANYVGQGIYAPGPFSPNAAVGFIHNADLNMGCTGNGIKWMGGNGLTLSDNIIQAVSGYSVYSGRIRGGFGHTTQNFLYGEVGSCTNPFYVAAGGTGNCNSSPANACGMAGTATDNGMIRITGEVAGNSGNTSGGFPVFAVGGATTYSYWLVINDGANVSMPLKFGTATPTAGTFIIYFPRYASQTGSTVTYDILKTTGVSYAGSAPAPSVAANIALTTALAQCSALICAFSDTQPALSSYTPVGVTTLTPNLPNWPGDVVLGGGATLYTDDVPTNLITTSQSAPSVFSLRCSAATAGIYVSCLAGNSAVNNNPPVGAMLLQESVENGGDAASPITGRLTFMYSPTSSTKATELITLVPGSNAQSGAIISDPNHRPAANAADAYIGIDTGAVAKGSEGIAYGAPVSQSWYIGNKPDNVSFAERLNSTGHIFNTPISSQTSLFVGGSGCNGCSPFVLSGSQVTDTFSGGSLGGNWTVTTGTWTTATNIATGATLGGDFAALAAYTGTTFISNQFAQGTVAVTAASSQIGVGVRLSSSTNTGYYFVCATSGGNIRKEVAGTVTSLATTAACVAGDVLLLRVIGSTLTAYDNGVQWGTATDTAITSGFPGLANFSNPGAGIKNWSGGDLNWTSATPIRIAPTTFALLPACASGLAGSLATVTDSAVQSWGQTITGSGSFKVGAYCDGTNWVVTVNTTSNCSAVGTAASPSVASCSAAEVGTFSCDVAASGNNCTIQTTAVTANSNIEITQRLDALTGTRLGVTCNTTVATSTPAVVQATAGSNFIVKLGTFTTNPECFSYRIDY